MNKNKEQPEEIPLLKDPDPRSPELKALFPSVFQPIERLLGDGRVISVYPISFGKARLGIGMAGAASMDDVW